MLVNKVEICGVNTSKLPVLTSSQMQVLFEAMQKGDASARTQLVNGNLRLVLSISDLLSGTCFSRFSQVIFRE
jgi:RNA polymerase sporulation-specific sigma factor